MRVEWRAATASALAIRIRTCGKPATAFIHGHRCTFRRNMQICSCRNASAVLIWQFHHHHCYRQHAVLGFYNIVNIIYFHAHCFWNKEILNLNKWCGGSDLDVFSVMWQPRQELLSSHQLSKKLRGFFQTLDQWSDVVVHRLRMDLHKKPETFPVVQSCEKRPRRANQPPRCPLWAAGLIWGTPGWP